MLSTHHALFHAQYAPPLTTASVRAIRHSSKVEMIAFALAQITSLRSAQ